MPFDFENLNPAVRIQMVNEINRDIAANSLYISPRLTEEGKIGWPALVREAAQSRDDTWLAQELRRHAWIKSIEEKKKPKGGFTQAKVPQYAPDMLAEGEFNRFYVRGVCLYAISQGIENVEVYRGKQVEQPRPESQARIGCKIPAQAILDDLRTSQYVEPALGVPPGPNSGLSVRTPE